MEFGSWFSGFSSATSALATGSRFSAATDNGWRAPRPSSHLWKVIMSELIPSKTKDEVEDGQDKSGEERREEEIKGDKPPHHD